MITTLTGSNSFTLKAELNRLTTEFVAEHTDMGLEKFDGEEAAYDQMREALESLPFLASKKMVALRIPSANKEFTENVERLLTELPETTDVIIHEPKLDKRSSYYKFLKNNTEYIEFNELDGPTLARWLSEQAKGAGGSLSLSDARYLIERVGANQQLLSNELLKLLAYDQNITRKSIDLLSEPTPQSTIFQLLDAAFAGNKKQMVKLYQEQRAGKVEPQQIIAMLAWQLHILAVVKTAGERTDNDIARDAKLNPYVVQKSHSVANRLEPHRLRQLIHELTKLDETLKSTAMDADAAVQHYLLTIASR